MALVNVLGSGYTVVKRVTHDKHDRSLRMEVATYTNSKKDVEVATFFIDIMGTNNNGYPVKSQGLNTPPTEGLQERDAYLVPANATGAWEGLEGKVVAWNGLTWDVMNSKDIFIADEEKYYVQSGGEWVVDPRQMSASEFDSWFSASLLEGDGQSLLRRCYDYIKSRPEFAAATDA